MGRWTWQIDAEVLELSAGAVHLLGVEPTAALPLQAVLAAVHPDDVDEVRRTQELVSRTGSPVVVEYRVRRPAGDVRDHVCHVSAVRGGDGRVARLVGVVWDATERKLAHSEATRNATLFSVAQRVGNLASMHWAHEAASVTWSDEIHHILGLSADLEPSRELFESLLHPEDLARFHAHRAAPQTVKLRLIRPDGELRLLECVAAHTDEVGVIEIVRDVTHLGPRGAELRRDEHHHLHNSMQMLSSMLWLASRSTNEDATGVLLVMRSRIQAMALVHASLHGSHGPRGVRLRELVPKLVSVTCASGECGAPDGVTFDIDDVELDAETAMPVSLIIAELLSGCRGGHCALEVRADTERASISISMQRDEDDDVCSPRATRPWGTAMIEALANQLHGELEHAADGISVRVRFPA